MWFNDWEEFYAASEQMLLQNPTKVCDLHKQDAIVVNLPSPSPSPSSHARKNPLAISRLAAKDALSLQVPPQGRKARPQSHRQQEGLIFLSLVVLSPPSRRGCCRLKDAHATDRSRRRSLSLSCFSQCIKFKTDQQADVKKLERLNNLFFSVSTNRPIAPSGQSSHPSFSSLSSP